MKDLTRQIDLLISRYPVLEESKQDIEKAYSVLEKCYETKHKVLIAGSGDLLPHRRKASGCWKRRKLRGRGAYCRGIDEGI